MDSASVETAGRRENGIVVYVWRGGEGRGMGCVNGEGWECWIYIGKEGR